jgi:hypothetical protein
MPLLDPTAPPQSLAIANSAVLMTLLDVLIANGVLDRSKVQNLVKSAMGLVGTRARSPEDSRALDVLDGLWSRFSERSSEPTEAATSIGSRIDGSSSPSPDLFKRPGRYDRV